MKKTLLTLTILFFLHGCSDKSKQPTSYESETLKVKAINSNVFIHVSYLQTNDFGKVSCNGMVYFNQGQAIVFDTPTDNHSSKELIDWVEKEQKKKIVAVVITHFHEDCRGGLSEFHDQHIKSYGSQKTIELLNQKGLALLPKEDFSDDLEIKVGASPVLIRYFGAGHTADNVVGYVPNENALFGGCLIKSANASKGNLEDANVAQWPTTVEKIKQEFPDLKIVVPGHGKSGGTELLDYTIQLFEKD